MNRIVLVVAAAATGVAGSVLPSAAAVATQDSQESQLDKVTVTSPTWAPCPATDPVLGAALKGLECGSVVVPLNYDKPAGKTLTLALTRAKHTAPEDQYQGIVLLNRGIWPGGIGRDLPTRYSNGSIGLPVSIASTYDWIGFDPRGVGASEPAVVCDSTYVYPGHAHPDPAPLQPATEQTWLTMAKSYADSCAAAYDKETLKHLNTEDSARDLDVMRRALGQSQINYLGSDWGSYLGSVYATLFPNRVRRMVIDGMNMPVDGSWYESNLQKNMAAEARAKMYFAWIARYDSIYHLGASEAAVEANYAKALDMVRQAPIDGMIGPWELEDIFEPTVYRNYVWINHAKPLADFVLRNDPTGLKALFTNPGFAHQNRHAMTNAMECRDSRSPDWQTWHDDYSSQYAAGNTFITWSNAWYNAPCAFWPVQSGQPVEIGNGRSDLLIVQTQNDAVAPLQVAYDTHAKFRNSRLLIELGGENHNAALSANANACINATVAAYFKDGTRPAKATVGPDAYCAANPEPVPAPF